MSGQRDDDPPEEEPRTPIGKKLGAAFGRMTGNLDQRIGELKALYEFYTPDQRAGLKAWGEQLAPLADSPSYLARVRIDFIAVPEEFARVMDLHPLILRDAFAAWDRGEDYAPAGPIL